MKPKKVRQLLKFWNLYGPYMGAGIKLKSYSDDFTRFEVHLKHRWYNRNLFGTHFGGSLYAMCDGVHALIFILNLGKNYIIWDKAACIEYIKPGEGTVRAIFEVSKEEIAEVKAIVDKGDQKTFDFNTEITDKSGEVVAKVKHTVYIRKKEKK